MAWRAWCLLSHVSVNQTQPVLPFALPLGSLHIVLREVMTVLLDAESDEG
jgi:hypothetical protein